MDMGIILSLALLLLFAKILGELAQRIKLPALLGEVTAGIILGPALLNMVYSNEIFNLFAEIGIILLIFIAGFEHGNINELLRYKGTSILISGLSSTMPVIAVVIMTSLQGFSLLTGLFLAVALGATSMGVSLRSLMSINQIDTKVGKTVIGSLVINDITGLVLLTIAVTYGDIVTSGSGNILFSVGKSLLSVLIGFSIFYIGIKLIPRITHQFINLKVEEAQFSLAMIIVLISAWAAAEFGLSSIIGAFFAGIMLSRSPIFETHNFHQKLFSISYGFFVPIFFSMVGVLLVFDNFFINLQRALIFFFVIAAVQVSCAFIAAKFRKYSAKESLLVGFSMLPYGEVTLVVMSALIVLSSNNPLFFMGEDIGGLFSSVLILIVLTVVVTPLFMKLINKMGGSHNVISKKRKKRKNHSIV